MKKTLLALALGITSSSAFAATVGTGSIHFFGQVDSGTCPIEIVDPTTGQPASRINMGNVNAAQFPTSGDEAGARPFGMRLTPGSGCTVPTGSVANVTFTSNYASPGDTLFALQPGGAQDLALVIKDNKGTPINNGSASIDYPLDSTKPTTMIFSAAYKSIGTAVTAGYANTDVAFIVDMP